MNNSFENNFYRLNTIISLLSSEEFSYSINNLSEILNVPKPILHNDILSLLKSTENSLYLYPNDDELEDDFIYSQALEKDILGGKYDDVSLSIDNPFKSDVSVSLTNFELNCLNDFLKQYNYNILKKDNDYLIKNSVLAFTDREILIQEAISNAITDDTCIDISYVSRGGNYFTRTIKPLRIVHNLVENIMHVVTIYEDKIYPYRLDRIKSVSPATKEIPKPDLSILPNLDSVWGMEFGDVHHVKAKIYNEANVIEKVKRDLGKRAKDTLTKINDTYYIFEDTIIGINSFRSWVNSYGSSIIVLEPRELANEIIDSAKTRYSYYSFLDENK